jgi:DNA-binding transcriptional LysR family regulator
MDKGLVDIGILIGQFNKEKYEVLQIPMLDRFVLFMSCDALLAEKEFVTKEDLLQISLTVPKTSEQQNYIEWCGKNYNKLNIIATHDLLDNVAMLVEEKLCYALTLEKAAKDFQSDKLCFRPLYPNVNVISVLAWKKHQSFSQTVSKFIEYMNDYMKEEM